MKLRWLRGLPVIALGLITMVALSMTSIALYESRTARGQFTVIGNTIYDPTGKVFIVKGVATAYGTFAGGDESGYGKTNYENAQRDFDIQKRLGINTVRIFVEAADNDSYHKRLLLNAVGWARQRGFVVELANSSSSASASLAWLSYLASTYKHDPYVWLEPMNEPNCDSTGDREKCSDWEFWQAEENKYIQVIRDAGMKSPIVINSIDWSVDLSKIDTYPLNDRNIIYGVHRYGNDHVTFDMDERNACNNLWANLTLSHAIIVDEVGAWDFPGVRNSFAWLQGFIDYVADWVEHDGGSGAIAFVWYWSDPNSMIDASGKLNNWGNLFVTHYLQRVTV